MIMIFPFLLITLHFSQIGFTDDLTFTLNPPFKKVRLELYHATIFNARTNLTNKKLYLSLQMIRPLEKSYGDNSSVTLSPGRILIKF